MCGENTFGFEYAKTSLEVIQVPVKPPEVLVVHEGKDRSVGCQATGNIQPRMKWSKSGGVLPAGRALILADGTLKLTNFEPEDAGEYVCTASVGKFGFTVGKMQLITRGKPIILSQSHTPLTHFSEVSISHLHKIKTTGIVSGFEVSSLQFS